MNDKQNHYNIKEYSRTYLRLGGCSIIIAIRLSAERSTRSVWACVDASSLRQVLLALGLADLDLLFLATTADNVGREGALGLELSAPVLGDVSLRHDCGGLWAGGMVVDC